MSSQDCLLRQITVDEVGSPNTDTALVQWWESSIDEQPTSASSRSLDDEWQALFREKKARGSPLHPTLHGHLISAQFEFKASTTPFISTGWKILLSLPWASHFPSVWDAACSNQRENAEGLINVFFSRLSQVRGSREWEALIKWSCRYLWVFYPNPIALDKHLQLWCYYLASRLSLWWTLTLLDSRKRSHLFYMRCEECVGISGFGSVVCEPQRLVHSRAEVLAIQMNLRVNYIRTGNHDSDVIIGLCSHRCWVSTR